MLWTAHCRDNLIELKPAFLVRVPRDIYWTSYHMLVLYVCPIVLNIEFIK